MMKKLILSLLLIVSITTIYAQKANVNKAKNKALMETPDFVGARELIKLALEDETTKSQANTWYVAGLIGSKENENFEKMSVLGQTDQDKKGQVVLESYNYLLVADELDQQPNEKGKVKPKFRRDIKRMVGEYYNYNLINYGAYLFDKNDYDGALNVFNVYLGIPDLPLSEGGIVKDSTYNMIQYYAAFSAANAGKNQEAIRHYEILKNKDYEASTVYQRLYEEYSKLNDTINFIRVLEEGMVKFPAEPWFLQNLINYHIYSGSREVALQYLNTAIERDPTLAQYRFVEGGLYEELGDSEKAKIAYLKTIEIDPTSANAYDALGRLHYKKAISILDETFNIRDAKKMREEEAKATAELRLALPFYQEAVKLDPETMSYKVLLRAIYYRLGMDKEYEAIDKEING